MTKVSWNATGERLFEAGVDRGVLFIEEDPGIPWNGLVSVNETPTGGEPIPSYVDGEQYSNKAGIEDYAGGISAFTYPERFAECDGTALATNGLMIGQQPRKEFCLTYRTGLGNDLAGLDYGYKIHLIYNALIKPSTKTYATRTRVTNPLNFSWAFSTRPISLQGFRASSHLVVDSTKADPDLLAWFEETLYGTVDSDPRMPTPQETFDMFEAWPFKVYDNGDGTWTAVGSDDIIQMLSPTEFQITWPGAVYIVPDYAYTLTSP